MPTSYSGWKNTYAYGLSRTVWYSTTLSSASETTNSCGISIMITTHSSLKEPDSYHISPTPSHSSLTYKSCRRKRIAKSAEESSSLISVLGQRNSWCYPRFQRLSRVNFLISCIVLVSMGQSIGVTSSPSPTSAKSPSSCQTSDLSWSAFNKVDTRETQAINGNLKSRENRESTSETLGVETSNATENQQKFITSLIAGVGSGSLASIVCAPLDLVRTRMQVIGGLKGAGTNPKIVQSLHEAYLVDGIRGCFRGLGVTLATIPAFWGLYFPMYEALKEMIFHWTLEHGDGGHNHHALVHLGSAITAGAVADVICNPMFVVRTRIQTEALHYFHVPVAERKPHGILSTVKNLYIEGGVPIFWRGLGASLLGLAHVGIQFPVYERLKAEARKHSTNGEESPLDLLIASGFSKMTAAVITYPHEVIRSRMMDARGINANKGVMSTLKSIVKAEGYQGLYVGLKVTLVRVVPNCCVTFVSYELIARWVRGQMEKCKHANGYT